MDETIKIIIGTLSGFTIAFFAEPIKIYFQTKAKINNLRLALYKEIAHNFLTIDSSRRVYKKTQRLLD